MIKTINHVTINTNNIEATRRFYGDLLGFREIKMIDCDDHRYYMFAINDSLTLEVGEYDFDDTKATDEPTAYGKIRHIAFETDNLQALAKTCEEAGFPFFSPPQYLGDEFGLSAGEVFDPNGVELEFVELGNIEEK